MHVLCPSASSAVQVPAPPDSLAPDLFRVRFAPTPALRALAARGLLVIFDEIQHLKNTSAQHEAAKAIIGEVCSWQGLSRCLLLSGSPFDKRQHALHLFQLLNIMRADEVGRFDLPTRQMVWTGRDEIVRACAALDAGTTSALEQDPIASRDAQELAYSLFQQVLKPAISSVMPCPPSTATLTKQNAFYCLDPLASRSRLAEGIDALERACGYNRATQTVNFAVRGVSSAKTMGRLTRAMATIERAKVSTMAAAARTALAGNGALKLVLAVNYTDTVRSLKEDLEEFAPLVLDGGVSTKGRARVISLFQAANRDRRLLIANLAVCSTGIDLDDTSGSFPRLCLVSPNWNALQLHQLGHRFLRLNTKGDSEMHMFYARDVHELPVLKALARKGSIMKEITPGQVAAGILFPGELPRCDRCSQSVESCDTCRSAVDQDSDCRLVEKSDSDSDMDM